MAHFKDWRNPTAEEIDTYIEEIQDRDSAVIARILIENRFDFAIVTIPVEGDFDGEVEIAIHKRDVSFVFTRTGRLKAIVNNRPKPTPVAAEAALKVP